MSRLHQTISHYSNVCQSWHITQKNTTKMFISKWKSLRIKIIGVNSSGQTQFQIKAVISPLSKSHRMWIINTDKTSLPRLICWYKGKPYNLRPAIVNNRLAHKIFVTVDTSRCANYACMKALHHTINWRMFMSITKDHQLTKEQTWN